ncbi:MAG: hypothetical protein E7257_05225 [Lachnospiraceae bacterium]|nr:hypothetical protein [Lachnospiraceae bacterium]
MYKVINEYTSKVNLQANDEIYNKISDLFNDITEIKKLSVSVSFNRYVLDIKLYNYSVKLAGDIFSIINTKLSYSYSSFFVRFNEGSCVRYRYITSNENKDAIYCDIIFS